jgi:FkbM family methyltransferase
VKKTVRWLLGRAGYTLVKSVPARARRKKLFDSFGIDLVLDVGANAGIYGRELRESGYRGRIVSFEPQAAAFARLLETIEGDPAWEALNLALGDREGEATLNIAANSLSSSILEMLPAHEQAAPDSGYVGRERVRLATLDSLSGQLRIQGRSVCLKIDTQGFEESVLRGAAGSLEAIHTLQLEMSLTPLYQGELLFPQMHALLAGKGYELVAVEPGFADPETGRLLQLDGIYHRFVRA